MTGGIGFSRQGTESFRQNHDLLKKKAPFQRIKENKFISRQKLNIRVTPQFLDDLHKIKKERKLTKGLRKLVVFLGLIGLAILLVVLVM